MNAPVLANFCNGWDKKKSIPINNTTPGAFRQVLRYIYGDDEPVLDRYLCEDVIDAANNYGLVGLKFAAEAFLVDRLILNGGNVAYWLMFADERTCPLLKEYATSYFVARATDLLDSKPCEVLDQSPRLLRELMKAKFNIPIGYSGETHKMTVTELRKKLAERGLDVEGSKELLVSRFEESKSPHHFGGDALLHNSPDFVPSFSAALASAAESSSQSQPTS
ncbi:hypothetical protein ACHAXR_007372 [Thalassiosira sp. AJA248-18]